MQILIKKKTKKDFTLSWLFLFLLQCTVSNDCFYKLSLATPRILESCFDFNLSLEHSSDIFEEALDEVYNAHNQRLVIGQSIADTFIDVN